MRHEASGSFPEAVLACIDGLYGFAMTLARDRSEAEDLVQETYLRAAQAERRPQAGTDSGGNNLRAWLFTIMRNLWLNRVRRLRGGPEFVGLDAAEHALPDASTDPQIVHLNLSLGEAVRAAIERLPPHLREVVVLRDVEDFNYKEIAEILGCPAGTVMSRLARARARLKGDLKDWSGAPAGEPHARAEAPAEIARANRYESL